MKVSAIAAVAMFVIILSSARAGVFSASTANGESNPPTATLNQHSPGAASAEIASEPAAATLADDARTIPPQERSALLRGASAHARARLDDGVVTRDEVVAAANDARACTVEATASLPGVTVGPVGDAESGWFGIDATTGDAAEAARFRYEACITEHLRDVLTAWNLAASFARVQPLWLFLAGCLREQGIRVDDGATWLEMTRAIRDQGKSTDIVDTCERSAPSSVRP